MTATQLAAPSTGEAAGSVEGNNLLDPESRRGFARDIVGGLLVRALAESGIDLTTTDPRLMAAAIALMHDVVIEAQLAACGLFESQRESIDQ